MTLQGRKGKQKLEAKLDIADAVRTVSHMHFEADRYVVAFIFPCWVEQRNAISGLNSSCFLFI